MRGQAVVTHRVSKAVLAALSAVGMFLPYGSPLPGSCLHTIGVAGAAPAPSCGGDLRACLRQSADLNQTTFGGRYVSADDVAMCMEAFRACISGGDGGGGSTNPPQSAASGAGTSAASLPSRFGIDHGDGVVSDCRITENSATCTANWKTANDSYNAEFTGTLSGMTMAGTTTTHRSGHAPDDPGCAIEERYTGPVTYIFSPGGGATFTAGPNERQSTFSGSCSGSNSGTTAVVEGTATWSAIR